MVEAVEKSAGALEFVNSGGTGSLEVSSADPAVTEVTAGSGLYVPTLFDGYRAFEPRPALYFALSVIRRPARAHRDAVRRRVHRVRAGRAVAAAGTRGRGLRLLRAEGAGEVQTPVRGPRAQGLAIGDRVWFRHAKAGELASGSTRSTWSRTVCVTRSVPTYRGEGKTFG